MEVWIGFTLWMVLQVHLGSMDCILWAIPPSGRDFVVDSLVFIFNNVVSIRENVPHWCQERPKQAQRGNYKLIMLERWQRG